MPLERSGGEDAGTGLAARRLGRRRNIRAVSRGDRNGSDSAPVQGLRGSPRTVILSSSPPPEINTHGAANQRKTLSASRAGRGSPSD